MALIREMAKRLLPDPLREWLNTAFRDPANDVIDRWKLARAARTNQVLRVAIGTGRAAPQPGWYRTNIGVLNLWRDEDWHGLFGRENRVRTLLAEHVLEHVAPKLLERGLRNCYRYLEPGGRLRISVPDGNNPDPSYLALAEPGGTGPGADDHRVLFSLATLTRQLEEAGFSVEPLEYYDEAGGFHSCAVDFRHGVISRAGKPPPERSLNVDAIKPAAPCGNDEELGSDLSFRKAPERP